MRKIFVLVGIFSVLLSAMGVAVAQQGSMTPDRGSIGTVIFINCGFGSQGASFANQPIAVDSNGFASFTVPTAYAPGTYPVSCQSPQDNSIRNIGTFTVTECPLLNERTITQTPQQTLSTFSAQGGGNLTGENISVSGRDTYRYISDFDNGNGAMARLVITSSDPTRLVNYINNMTFDFAVYSGRPSEDLSNCQVDINLPIGTSQANRTDDPSLSVEFVLLSGGSIQTDRNYLVYYAVSSTVEPQLNHVYFPENSTAIAGRLEDYTGFLNLSAWDTTSTSNYEDSVNTYNPTLDMPGVVSQSFQESDYRIAVTNLVDTNATYTLSGTYQTMPCDTTRDNCLGTQREPQTVVLSQGRGISSGNPVYNGNFEVEAYCQQINPGSEVTRDDVDWYCENENGFETRLTEADFTEICRQTYNNPQAFAVRDLDLTTPDDSPSNIPAYNWRCLGPANS